VKAVGEAVASVKPGDAVAAIMMSGGFAEQALAREADVVPLPAGVDPVQASAFLFTYGTSYHALKDRAALMPGETLLVLGAAGGVGLAAVEIGKAIAARVIAAASSEEKAAAAQAAGADATVVYPKGPFDQAGLKQLSQTFKDAVGPTGADVIFDPVGGDYSEAALRSIAWQGRFLVVGFPAGIAKLPLNLTLLKSCDVCGVFWGGFVAHDPKRNAAHVDQLFRWWAQGKIAPKISASYPLERAGEAIAALRDRRAIGKLVVTLG
jgi:NADPH:quinone reductase-like Zn-dependent oxidoreductase